MIDAPVANIRDCSLFRQTLLAKPPAIVHGTAILLVVLVIAAVTWASLTDAWDEAKFLPFPPPAQRARKAAQMLFQRRDTFTGDAANPLRRRTDTGRPMERYNVVVIMMESMSGKNVGVVATDRRCRPS